MRRITRALPARALLEGLFVVARQVLLSLGILCFAASSGLANVDPEESRFYVEEAKEFVAKGDLASARIKLKNALQRDPENADARFLLGQVQLRLGNGAAAEKELRAAERYGMPASQTAVYLGRALHLQGLFEELLSSLDPEAHEPELGIEILLLHAEAYAGLRRFDEARATYAAIEKSNPEDARIELGLASVDLLERELDAAEARARAALALNPDLSEAFTLLAEAQRLRGKPEAAVALYRDALDGKDVPAATAVRAHLGYAAALLALERDEEAEAEVLAAKSLFPRSPLATYFHALIKVRARNYDAARIILSTAGRRLDHFAPAQFLFGVVYYSSGELEIARPWLNRHLRAQPENLPARKLLGATLLRLGSITEAVEILERGLARHPDDPQLMFLMGRAYIRSGRPAEAEALLQRAIEVGPQDPRILSQLAISQIATGRSEEALAALETTLDLGADASAIGYVLAFVHLRAGEFSEALTVAQELRQRFPESTLAANLEGGAYAGLGQLDKAQESFEAALAIEPEFVSARTNLAALKAQAGNLEGAEADYLAVLDSEESNVKALVGLVALADRRGDPEGARGWLLKAVEAEPQAVEPALALARNYEAAGEVPAALTYLSELADRLQDLPAVLVELGAMQRRAGQAAEAVGTYWRLVDATNEAADARLLLAQAFQEAGEINEARRILKETLAAHPNHLATVGTLIQFMQRFDGPEVTLNYAKRLHVRYPDVYWTDKLLGDLLAGEGRLDEAIAAYQSGWVRRPTAGLAIALFQARTRQGRQTGDLGEESLASLHDWLAKHPGDDTVRLALAEGLLSLGALDRARAEYEALKTSQEANPIVWNNLAWIYHQAGDARAVSHGERALELAPGQPVIADTLGWILLDAGEVARATSLLKQAHLAVPTNRNFAYRYAMALHRSGEDAAAVEVLQALLAGEEAFSARAEATDLLGRLSP